MLIITEVQCTFYCPFYCTSPQFNNQGSPILHLCWIKCSSISVIWIHDMYVLSWMMSWLFSHACSAIPKTTVMPFLQASWCSFNVISSLYLVSLTWSYLLCWCSALKIIALVQPSCKHAFSLLTVIVSSQESALEDHIQLSVILHLAWNWETVAPDFNSQRTRK